MIIIVVLIVCVIVAVTILCVIRSPKNHSPTEDLRLLTVNSGSPSMGTIHHDGHFKVRRSKVSGTTWTPAIDRTINRYDYSNMDTNNKLVANQYGSNSYRDSYDPTYNVGAYGGFKQDDGKVIGIPAGSTITNGPGFGVNYSPAYGPYNWPIENTPIIDHHKLTSHLPTPITNIPTPVSMTPDTHQSQIPQNKIVIPIPNEFLIDWRKIGIIALSKLVLVKLKAFSVIKILLFLMFKLKFIVVIISAFKFILLFKFIKLFKVLLPLFLLPLFLTMLLSPLFFISIYSIPERIAQLLRMPMGAPATPAAMPAPVSAPSVLPPSRLNVPAPSNPAPSNPAPSNPAPSPPAPSPPAQSPPAPPTNTIIDPFNVLGRPT